MQYGRSDRRSPGFNMVLQGKSFSKLAFIGSLIVLFTLMGLIQESTSEVIKKHDHVHVPLDEEGEGPFDCTKMAMRGAKRIMKFLSRCSREVKANSTNTKEFSEKMGCVMKCVMVYTNLTNSEDKLTPETTMIFLKQFLRNEILIHEMHTFMVSKCGNTAAKLNPTEEKCRTYGDYAMCLQTGIEDFMNTSQVCIKKPKKTVTVTRTESSSTPSGKKSSTTERL